MFRAQRTAKVVGIPCLRTHANAAVAVMSGGALGTRAEVQTGIRALPVRNCLPSDELLKLPTFQMSSFAKWREMLISQNFCEEEMRNYFAKSMCENAL